MRIQISWTVASDPLADKLNWYVTRCTVKGKVRKYRFLLSMFDYVSIFNL